MSESKTWVEAIIDPSIYPNLPGSVITLWGFKFKIYPGKHLCLEMPNDFVKTEVRAGHVRVMQQPPPGVVPKKKPVEVKPVHKEVEIDIQDESDGFTMDVGNYYGAGDLDKLIEKLQDLGNVAKIKAFARKRFDVSFPNTAKRDEILDHIRVLVDYEISKDD